MRSGLITFTLLVRFSAIAFYIASMQAFPQTASIDACGAHGSRPAYFPSDLHLAGTGVIAMFLCAMHEPSLLEAAQEHTAVSYRFTWFHPFSLPVLVRLNIRPDGTGQLFTKVISENAKFIDAKTLNIDPNGALGTDKIEEVPAQQVATFLELINTSRFWTLPVQEQHVDVFDADTWAIEGVRNGLYHVAFRKIPQPSSYTEIARYLAKALAKLDDSVIVIPAFHP